MRTFNRITLLGLLCAVVTTLPVDTGFSAGPSSLPNSSDFSRRPIVRVFPGRLDVEPKRPAAQQISSSLQESRQRRAFDLVQLRVAPDPVASPVSSPPASADSSRLPAWLSPLVKAAPGIGPIAVEGEGDGKLSIHIPDEPIRDVLELISRQGNLNILASKSVQGNVSATLNDVDLASALDAILKATGYVAKREGNFIFVGTAEEFQMMKQAMDKIGTRVYRPNYITAAELQALITPLLTEAVGVVSVSSPAETGIGADDSQAGGDAFAGAEVLIVRDYEAVLAEIDQMVGQVNARPLQVAIEAMILSVKLDDENKLGVDFEFSRNNDDLRFGLGKPANQLPVNLASGGLQFAFLDTNFSAFVNALEEIKDTNVIATPRLMVLNKHRADIQIGRQEGYVSTTATETSTTQSVEFLDTGTLLRLRPFISSDGMIRMEIHPELSSGEVKLKGDFTVPEKEVTQVTTNIMVRDGCTVLIGGLIREELVSKPTQVPLLGSLPLVGPVFRSTTEQTIREEILVLVTPRIVYEPDACREGDQAACEFHRRQSLFADKLMSTSKTYVGRKYFRLARNAWAAGDPDTALRFAELSVHFDPMNRAAIDLRSNIWQGRGQGEHTLGVDTPAEPPSHPETEEIVPRPSGEDLGRASLSLPAPLPPVDRGRLGPRTAIVQPRRLP